LDVFHSPYCVSVVPSCGFMSKFILKMAWYWSKWSLSIVEFGFLFKTYWRCGKSDSLWRWMINSNECKGILVLLSPLISVPFFTRIPAHSLPSILQWEGSKAILFLYVDLGGVLLSSGFLLLHRSRPLPYWRIYVVNNCFSDVFIASSSPSKWIVFDITVHMTLLLLSTSDLSLYVCSHSYS